MKGLIQKLLKKTLLEYYLIEATPTTHFNDRFDEVIDSIVSIQIPHNIYIPNISKETQDEWIITQIKDKIKVKVNLILKKPYPIAGGICVLAPLGMIKIQPLKGNPANILITSKRKEGITSGTSYYAPIYDDRLPTIVLADPRNPNNSSVGNQLVAHIKNNLEAGYKVNKDKSFVDRTFMDNIMISISDFNL